MQRRTRRDVLRATGALGATATLAGCLGSGNSEPVEALDAPEGTEVVEVGPDGSLVFRPGTDEPLRVKTGTTVRWVWLSDGHDVKPTSQPDAANWQGHQALEGRGFYFEDTFDVPGTYEYVCTPHRAMGMTGTLVVEESG